ncbi:MAG: DUF418 domain-containing protein [Planctomycetota bacterium]
MSPLISDASPPSPATPTPGSPLAPTAGSQRIVSIDVLRGVVLLGILVMNVSFMGWPEAWAMDSLRFVDDRPIERGLWWLAEVFANMKMMSIFSLLFGAGVVMMADRALAAGRSSAGLHYKRMGWLLLIGLVHLFLMWYGDILVLYALVGSVAYLLRRLPVVWLLVIACVLLAVVFVIWLGFAGLVLMLKQHDPAQYAAFEMYDMAEIEGEVAAYRGGLLDQLAHRVPSALFMVLLLGPMLYFWWAGGMMLLGMAAMKSRLLAGAWSSKAYAGMLAVGGLVGVPLAGGLAWYKLTSGSERPEMVFLLMSAHFATTLLIVPGWVGGVMLLCKQPWFAKVSHPLACVGRMALTNYLSQTLIVTFIFYGHGLGYFAKLERPAMFGIVLGVWVLQLVWSPIWLARFRFGPMEWVWRSLTYLRLEPMRRRAAVGGGA